METMYVYILTNDDKNVMYVGVTNDLVRRMYEHKNRNSFTARYNVHRLVYFEYTNNPEAAIEREKQIKGWNRARKNKLVESKNPNWDDLYESIQQCKFSLKVRGLPRQCAHWLAMTSLFYHNGGVCIGTQQIL